MPGSPPTPFSCPACGAKYKVVKIEASDPETTERDVRCKNCGALFEAREGTSFLKYFLVGPRRRRNTK